MGAIRRSSAFSDSGDTPKRALVNSNREVVAALAEGDFFVYCDTDDVTISGALPAGVAHIGEVDIEVKKYAPDTQKAEVSMSATQAQIVDENTDRKEVIFQNIGDEDVYLGAVGVTTGNYFLKLAAGDVFIDDRTTIAWYGICASGKTSTIKHFEIGSSYPAVA